MVPALQASHRRHRQQVIFFNANQLAANRLQPTPGLRPTGETSLNPLGLMPRYLSVAWP